MLDHLDAEELYYWRGYEASEGRLDNSWDREIQARQLEVMLAQGGVKNPEVGRPWVVLEDPEKEAQQKQAAIDGLDKAIGALPRGMVRL